MQCEHSYPTFSIHRTPIITLICNSTHYNIISLKICIEPAPVLIRALQSTRSSNSAKYGRESQALCHALGYHSVINVSLNV